jgi:small-conductance mechanosensitive channel
MPTLRWMFVFVALLLATTSARAEEANADRTTPRRAVGAFLDAAEARDFDRAAQALDLRSVHPEARQAVGRDLAEKLEVVLDRATWIELSQLSDDPSGRPADGDTTELVAVAHVGAREVPIMLTRTSREPSEWVFSALTLARLPKLYEEHGPTWIERRLPASLRGPRFGGLEGWQWLGLVLAFFAAYAVALVIAWVAIAVGGRLAARTTAIWDGALIQALRAPARLFATAVLFRSLLASLALSAAAMHVVSRLVGLVLIASAAWIVIRVVVVAASAVERRAQRAAKHEADAELRARGIATQVRVLRRVINVAVAIVATALMLTQWEIVRNIGVSLLASAGIAGIVLGFAAQRTIGSLIAGVQLSATQPIRIGDVVVVEKEWGVIEEVTLTYVVVKVWDERRLIVPMTRFLEHPFENWTKTSADLHGTIFLSVDWRLPIDVMRAQLDRIVDGNPRWDGRTKGIVVTDAKGPLLEVRALVSASNAGKLWELRCEVREKLVHWLQTYEDGKYLPVTRHEARIASVDPATREVPHGKPTKT